MHGSKMLAGFAIAALAGGGLAACGGGDDTTAGGGDGIEITGAWARTSPAMAEAGAAYMTITNSSEAAVSVVSASVDPEVAGVAELHEVVPADGAMEAADGEMDHSDMADGETADGEMAMTMQEVSSIDVPAGGSVSLEPGGYHVMLLELPDPLATGEEFEVTLQLADDTEVVVPVIVSENGPE